MKKFLMLLMIVALFYGCSKEDNDVYYVKYELEMPTLHISKLKHISYQDATGTIFIDVTDPSWTGTFGPVKKGFTASLSCELDDPAEYIYSNTHLHGRIYVSRNDEPFAIKVEDDKKGPISISYNIDY